MTNSERSTRRVAVLMRLRVRPQSTARQLWQDLGGIHSRWTVREISGVLRDLVLKGRIVVDGSCGGAVAYSALAKPIKGEDSTKAIDQDLHCAGITEQGYPFGRDLIAAMTPVIQEYAGEFEDPRDIKGFVERVASAAVTGEFLRTDERFRAAWHGGTKR